MANARKTTAITAIDIGTAGDVGVFEAEEGEGLGEGEDETLGILNSS